MLASSLAGLSIAHMYAGEYDRVIALSGQALQIGRSEKGLWEQSKSQLAVGEAYRQRGEYDRAIEAAEESIRLGESGAFISSQTHTRARLALVYADLGALDRAFKLIEIALQVAEGHKYTVDLPFIWGIRARLQIAAGRLAEATDTIEAAKEDPYRESWVVFHFPVLIAEVEFALREEDFGRAAQAADHLIDSVRQYGVHLHLPEALYLKAKALLSLRRGAAGRDHLLEARAEAEALGARRILWRILDTLSRLESDPARARELREEARQVIRTIVAHIDQGELRTSFLSLPEVREAIRQVE
jgi:tetratricopeptide (TPR) repeat protein